MEYQLYCGDCLEVMQRIPDSSVDMVLCDLPYGETNNAWDKRIDLKRIFDEYERIAKDSAAIVLTGSFRFGCMLYGIASHLYKYEWIWQKDNGTNVPMVNFQPFKVHEMVYVFGKGRTASGTNTPMKYHPQKTAGRPYCQKQGRQSTNWHDFDSGAITNNVSGLRHPLTIQRFNRDKNKWHPTQKPVSMLSYLIRTYTDKGDTVLDNCMGSGSTGVACVNTGRNFIGIELNQKYFDIAKKRIEAAEVPLF